MVLPGMFSIQDAASVGIIGAADGPTAIFLANYYGTQYLGAVSYTHLDVYKRQGLVGMAGALYAQYQGSADINMGRGAIVIGLASVIVGEVVFGNRFNFAYRLASIAGGSIIYYIVIAFVVQCGMPTQDLKLFSALTVAVFLALPYLRGKYFKKSVQKKKGGRTDA